MSDEREPSNEAETKAKAKAEVDVEREAEHAESAPLLLARARKSQLADAPKKAVEALRGMTVAPPPPRKTTPLVPSVRGALPVVAHTRLGAFHVLFLHAHRNCHAQAALLVFGRIRVLLQFLDVARCDEANQPPRAVNHGQLFHAVRVQHLAGAA